MASAIPAGLREQVERDTGCVVAAEQARGGGGASRQGAEVALRAADGGVRRCYLAWDARAGDPSRFEFFRRETTILKALSGPLSGAGVRVAPLIGAYPSHLALLSAFVPGHDRFPQAPDKRALARDFVSQLAVLHRLDARAPEFAALGDASQPPSQIIRDNLSAWRQLNLDTGGDPIIQVAIAWLSRTIPEDRGPPVVLHGDAGPGNFLYQDDQVVALVDWELCHLGDPMEDLAQIWVRSLIQPFVPMAQVVADYEAAGGRPVDRDHIRFHRLYFQLSFTVPGAALAARPGSHVQANGAGLMFSTLHKRVMVRSVAELAGIPLADPEIADLAPDWTDRYFAAALADLKDDILPAVGNERAAAKTKELARLVKFWRSRASHGASVDAAELADIATLIPGAPARLPEARAALAEAIAHERVDFVAAVRLCHRRMARETFVMSAAMGALATAWYEEEG
jgi:hypothetical protein